MYVTNILKTACFIIIFLDGSGMVDPGHCNIQTLTHMISSCGFFNTAVYRKPHSIEEIKNNCLAAISVQVLCFKGEPQIPSGAQV
jgi:hypothetical protein